MSEEILALSTVVERATVRISSKRHPAGKLYELLNVQDLGILEHAKVLAAAAVVDRLKIKKRRTPKDERALRLALTESVKLVLPSIEPAVLRELNNAQLEMIVITWGTHGAKDGEEGNPRRRRTGAASSRASSGSTAATPKRGSTRRSGS